MNTGHYYYDDGKSRKFWSYTQRGKKQTISHGRIGSKSREKTKTFPSPAAAKADTEKLIHQKIRKSYILVDPTRLKITRPKGKRKATEAQVAKLEKQIGSKLPVEYREFLMTQNGGLPDPYCVKIPPVSYIDSVGVGYILGLYTKCKPYESLLYAVEKKLPLLPQGQLPIAGEGDLFSISLTKKPGCIYFWDHEAVMDEDEDGIARFHWEHATLLAGSFNEFLTRIAAFGDDD